MLKHILVLFENQKRNYGGMCIGQMIVFIVVLYCFISIGDTMKRYYTLGRLETDNVISFYNYMRDNRVMDQVEELLRMDDLCRSLKNCSLHLITNTAMSLIRCSCGVCIHFCGHFFLSYRESLRSMSIVWCLIFLHRHRI